MNFAAIDFETADYGADSACALGVVKVSSGRVARSRSWLIRPPRSLFAFTHIHGLRWQDVAGQPTFAELWPEIRAFVGAVDFFAAHNASFDRGVLAACCVAAGFAPPPQDFVCTVRLARSTWGLRPANLPAVCRHLGLSLKHHDALSDAEACARIVLAAAKDGAEIAQRVP